MTRTPPTIDELRSLGLRLLDSAKEQLRKTKNLTPVIILGDAADGSADMLIGIEGATMNSVTAKDALSAKVRSLIADRGYMHSVMLSDIWGLRCKDESDLRKMRLLHGVMGLSLAEISKSGIGELTESACVWVETVGRTMMLKVDYRRDDEGNVVAFGKLDESSPGLLNGRFKFFGSVEEGLDGAI